MGAHQRHSPMAPGASQGESVPGTSRAHAGTVAQGSVCKGQLAVRLILARVRCVTSFKIPSKAACSSARAPGSLWRFLRRAVTATEVLGVVTGNPDCTHVSCN